MVEVLDPLPFLRGRFSRYCSNSGTVRISLSVCCKALWLANGNSWIGARHVHQVAFASGGMNSLPILFIGQRLRLGA